MFWTGPPIRYSEHIDKPATICLSFDTEKDIADQITGAPIIRPSGVGLDVEMKNKDNLDIYVGLALQRSVTRTFICEVPQLETKTYFVDENNLILTDQDGAWLTI